MKTQSTYLASTSLLKARVDDIFGSYMEVSIVGLTENKAYALWKEVTKELSSLEKTFDSGRADSEVSVLNASKVNIETSETMKEALNICESYLIKTQGLFNVSSGENEQLDFSGFIVGYAIQRIAAILKKGKVKDAFLNFGGQEIYAVGHKPFCEAWPYTIEDPESGDEIDSLELKNEAIAFSHTEDGKLCAVRSKDPLEVRILSLVLPVASEGQRHAMSYSFKNIDERYLVFCGAPEI